MKQAARPAAVVSLAIMALRDHCAIFGILRERAGHASWQSVKTLNFAAEAWYHSSAFVATAVTHKKKPGRRGTQKGR